MKSKVFFVLFLLLLCPISLVAEGQTLSSAGGQASSAGTGQIAKIRIVSGTILESKPSGEGGTVDSCAKGGGCPKEISQEDIKKPTNRKKLASRKEPIEIGGEEETVDDTLDDLVDEDGIDSNTPGMASEILAMINSVIPPTKDDLGGRMSGDGTRGRADGMGVGDGEGAGGAEERRPQGDGAGQQQGRQQDQGQGLAGLGQVLQGLAGLLGALKEPETPQQTTQAPLQQEKAKAVKCADVNGKMCSTLKNECSETVVTQDSYGNSICCVGACKPLTASIAGQEALQNVADAKSTPSTGFKLSGDGTTVTSLDGTTNQETSSLNKGTDTVLTRADSIDVLNGKATNLYTLANTKYGVKNYKGIFMLDPTGEILISVGEENGALTLDNEFVLMWLAPGITKYNHDSYETNTKIYSPQTGVALMPIKPIKEPLTGMASASFSGEKTSFSFGNRGLSVLLQNAIDVSFGSQNSDYIILAKGNEDMLLSGIGGFFPVAIRKFAKGDTAIIYDLSVKVNQRYKIKDSNYEYSILSEGNYTKVKIPNGKIIEESGSMPLRALTNTQQQLITKDN